MRQKSSSGYERLDPRPKFRVSYWWGNGSSKLKSELLEVQMQDADLHIHIPEEHARYLRGQITIVRIK